MSRPAFTVVFSTCNRKEMLVQALEAVMEKWKPPEIIVADDASTDGTGELLRKEYPRIRHICPEENIGPAAIRNRGILAASNDLVIGLDDDTLVLHGETVDAVCNALHRDRIGAVALPFANVLQSPKVLCEAPDAENQWVTSSFVAAAYAVRRSFFEKYGPFRTLIRFMNEEDDLTLRFLNNGCFTGLVDAPIVHHMQSLVRNTRFADIYGRRNDILFHACNAPASQMMHNILGTTYKGFAYGIKSRHLYRTLKGFWLGYSLLPKTIREERSPVSTSAYSLYNRLKRSGPLRLEAAVKLLES